MATIQELKSQSRAVTKAKTDLQKALAKAWRMHSQISAGPDSYVYKEVLQKVATDLRKK